MKINMALRKNIILNILGNIRTAKAEEPIAPTNGQEAPKADNTDVTEPQQTSSSVNFEDLINKARKEEKEKLYKEINKLKAQLDEKVGRINELLLVIGEKDETIKAKEKELAQKEKDSQKTDSEEVKALKLKLTELENALAQKDSEITTIKLDSYKATKMAQAGGELIPELVTGNTPEEIDMAIEKSKAKYLEIVGRVKATIAPALDSNNIPPANPNVDSFNAQVQSMDIAGLSMFDKDAMKQYSEMRKQMGLK